MRWLNCLVVASLAAGSVRAFHTWHELLGSLAGRATYAFGVPMTHDDPSPGSRRPLEPTLHGRIRAELRQQLAARGYSGTAAPDAQLRLSFSVGMGRERPHLREGPATLPAAITGRASLVVRLLDPRSSLVIWRGWDDAALGPGCEHDARIAAAVRRIIAGLPAAQR